MRLENQNLGNTYIAPQLHNLQDIVFEYDDFFITYHVNLVETLVSALGGFGRLMDIAFHMAEANSTNDNIPRELIIALQHYDSRQTSVFVNMLLSMSNYIRHYILPDLLIPVGSPIRSLRVVYAKYEYYNNDRGGIYAPIYATIEHTGQPQIQLYNS